MSEGRRSIFVAFSSSRKSSQLPHPAPTAAHSQHTSREQQRESVRKSSGCALGTPCANGQINLIFCAARAAISPKRMSPYTHTKVSVLPKGSQQEDSFETQLYEKQIASDSKRIFSDSSHRSQLSGGQKTSIRSYHVLRKITAAGDSGFTKV